MTPSTAISGSTTKTKPKQYICYLCSKTFDDIDILNSHKKLDHGSTKKVDSTNPRPDLFSSHLHKEFSD
jgi:hypothetical protein